ncbi:hypothetical protein J3F83DRAFT_767047 [Trichoderma novae-zelandiae]
MIASPARPSSGSPRESRAIVPGTCLNCRRQKQRCDRLIPQCSRCSMKATRCVYPSKDGDAIRGLVPVSSTSHMITPCSRPCKFHLSPFGERDLLWAACSKNGSQMEADFAQPSLSRLVGAIFDHGGISPTNVVGKYFDLAYHWLPTLDRGAIYDEAAQFNLEESVDHDAFSLLLLCMHLFAESPCQDQSQPRPNTLYRASRQLFAILHSSAGISPYTLLQCGIILSTYACGHGLSNEAYETLTLCIGLIRRLSIDCYMYNVTDTHKRANYDQHDQHKLDRCWSGIILLDRTIALSSIDHSLPYLVEAHHLPPSSAIFRVSKSDLYGRDAVRNLLARAEFAIRLGDMLRAIRGSDVGKYETIETEIYKHISDYICTTQGGNFPLCETVAMSLSALIMLYRKHDYYKTSVNNPKTILTFRCAHNMIMETCRAEAEWVQRHGWLNNSRPCFLGLCCLYGAAAHLDELCLEGLSTEDMWTLRNSLMGFSSRWKLGGCASRQFR